MRANCIKFMLLRRDLQVFSLYQTVGLPNNVSFVVLRAGSTCCSAYSILLNSPHPAHL